MQNDKLAEQYISFSSPTVIKFASKWDGQCRQIAEVYERVVEALDGRAIFLESDINGNPELAEKFIIEKVPTIAVFFKSKKVAAATGFMTKRHMEEFLLKAIAKCK